MNASDFAARLNVVLQQWPADIAQIVQKASDAAEHRMHQHFTPWQGDGSWRSRMHGKLFRRGGTLEDSLRVSVEEEPNKITARFTMASPGATTQEFGATITPKVAGALTIPMGEQLYPDGRRRYSNTTESRQDFGLFKQRDALLGTRRGSSPSMEAKVQWLLRQQVTIPARPVISPEVAVAANEIADQCAGRIADLLAGEA